MRRNKTLFWPTFIVLICLATCLVGQDQKSQVPVFKVGVETVYLKVAVSDPLDRYVTGLQKEDFRIYEDNVEQTINHFSQLSAPVSVGIVLDVSGSMGYSRNLILGKQWLTLFMDSNFMESSTPDDEFFLITFNKTVKLVQDFTRRGAEIENDVAFQKSGGTTALYDAVYRGVDQLRDARNEKKALILITDGEENSSRYRMKEIRDLCKESDVQIYGVGMTGPEMYGISVLKSIAEITGGRAFFRQRGQIIQHDYFDLINAELRNQYVLGYSPSNTVRDGKWRRIRVKLEAPRGFPKMSIRTRPGYYAPKH